LRLAKSAIAGIFLACVAITAWQSTLWSRHEHDITLAIPGAVLVAVYVWEIASKVWSRAVSRAAARLVAKDETSA